MSLSGKRIVVGVTGGIAAYKAVFLTRELLRKGAEVRVVMTPSATKFVGPITFSGITGQPALTDLWDANYAGEAHVELGAWADAMVIAPLTMNSLSKLAMGIVDDAVGATAACTHGVLLVAPAMHHEMWNQSATQSNVELLQKRGVVFVGPVSGELASREVGEGRMAEPTAIVEALESSLEVPGDLAGVQLLVTAGPTYEDLDPVRYLGNRSSGKMGYAIAERALARGASVTLISGPTELEAVEGVQFISVRSALEMHTAVMKHAPSADVIVMAAAVADYRPADKSESKLKKGADLTLSLVRNPDILKELGQQKQQGKPMLVGFALESEEPTQAAKQKLLEKNADLIVANQAKDGLGSDDNRVILIDREDTQALPLSSKRSIADKILDRVAHSLNPQRAPRRIGAVKKL